VAYLIYPGDLSQEFNALAESGTPFGEDSTGWPYVVVGCKYQVMVGRLPRTVVQLESMDIEAYSRLVESNAGR
jgi:hypothetical protein